MNEDLQWPNYRLKWVFLCRLTKLNIRSVYTERDRERGLAAFAKE